MENLLQLIERQRERKANRSAVVSHNSSGSDVHDGATFTVGLFNVSHNVSNSRHPKDLQLPKHDDMQSESVGRLQPCVDAEDETVAMNHVRHPVDEPVFLRSEANRLWKKDAPPKVLPRKVASMPTSSHQSMYRLSLIHI